MNRSLASVWAVSLVALGMMACHVEESHARCASTDDCASGEECYLGFCVEEDNASSESTSSSATGRDAAANGSTRTRPRTQPTTTGRSEDDDAAARVSMNGTTQPCMASDEDAGAAEGACCTDAVSCYDGPQETLGMGRCKVGKRACEGGRAGACEGEVQPRAESCDNEGVDDDCDGTVDNVRNRGKACTLDASAKACGEGKYQCVDGKQGLQCVPATAPVELCNNKDDDCDSKIDEGFDLKKDELNCGACGTRCGIAQSCCNGSCVARGPGADGCPVCGAMMPCPNGGSCCGGGCFDVQTDHNNCGSCGKACGARETCCGGSCVDTRTNITNCGRCGTTCSQGTTAACCAGDCVDLAVDHDNCGQCGTGCGVVCSCSSAMCRGVLGNVCF